MQHHWQGCTEVQLHDILLPHCVSDVQPPAVRSSRVAVPVVLLLTAAEDIIRLTDACKFPASLLRRVCIWVVLQR
jgi:hypothetical protein